MSKTRYSIYRMMNKRLIKILRKQYAHFKKFTDVQCMNRLFQMQPGLMQQMTFFILCDEYKWERHGRNAIFIESEQDLNCLLKGKYSINSFPDDLLPYNSYMLCLPDTFKVGNLKPTGLLVSVIDPKTIDTDLVGPYLSYIEYDAGNISALSDTDTKQIAISYILEGESETSRCVVNENSIMEVMKTKTAAEYEQVIGKLSKTYSFTSSNLTQEEYELQYQILKLVLGSAIYAKANPKALVTGLPNVQGNIAFNGILNKNAHRNTIKTKKLGQNDTEAHRTWFIRQLSHEKYYKGEFQHLSAGSRFVFVDETIVNQKLDSETLKVG
ncbi:MAG: hypothetical protein HAW67_01260 [Endozoicomonadaceae bacterium]|nr:hypothetical protein [Endozoicomonadaceae bacterium]